MDTKREHRAHAEGSPRGKPCDLSHSPSGRLIGKFRDNNSVTLSATIDMAYGWYACERQIIKHMTVSNCDDYQPHAVKRMFNYRNGMLYDLRWDEAGNLGQVSMAKPDEMFEAGRFLFWTEDNRMHVAADDRYYSYYAYDHSGERRLKLTGKNDLLDVNADIMATYTLLNEPTLYPSAYMVLTNKGYTKHYYAGTERVAARLGGGGLDALYHAIGNDGELQEKADLLFEQSLEQVNNRVLQENDLDCIKNNEFTKEEFGHSIDGIPYQMQAGVELNHDQFKDMVYSRLDDPNEGEEKDVFFYHSDHLGSASWITDGDGMPVQHLQYLPYGEPFVNQRVSGYNERFTFTGKERDEETGYSYFGARYMEHELMTMWLSVDPMSDKYPSISPYNYCMWNPVRLVDPDGRETYVAQNSDGTYRVIGGKLNKDRNIYLYKQDESGEYTIRCGSIGKSATTTSFYNTDANDGTGAWAIGSIIDPNDKSGIEFLNRIVGEKLPLKDYMKDARNNHKYDFKVTNGEDNPIPGIDIYRGMPIGGNAAGDVIYASARDVGNIAAGYMAGANGISWKDARVAFDVYQKGIEGLSTRNAEYYGWCAGYNPGNVSTTRKLQNLLHSVISLFK